MEISVTDAKAQLTDLVRRAEAGDEIILTRHGRAAVRLAPMTPVTGRAARSAVLKAVRATARSTLAEGESAARSQDFLYDEAGLPK